MDPLRQALSGAQHQPRPAPITRQTLLVVGAGGALGSAVLAEVLVAGRFQRVWALVAEPLASAVRGLEALPQQRLLQDGPLMIETAVIVFDRLRRSNGRDDAFVRPDLTELLPLATALRRRGVRRLMVVVPHAPASLPQALSRGLASLDEAGVVALDFEQLVLLRTPQSMAPPNAGGLVQRFAQWWLSQLSWMVPQRQQVLRLPALARSVAELAQLLPTLQPGTRVIAPETLWSWSQDPKGLSSAVAADGLSPPNS